VLHNIIAKQFQSSLPYQNLPESPRPQSIPPEVIWSIPDPQQPPSADPTETDPTLQTIDPETGDTNVDQYSKNQQVPNVNDDLLAAIREEIDESVQAVYSSSQKMDHEFLEQVVVWQQQIMENFEESQINLRETQEILSDQFRDRELTLYELQSELYVLQSYIEESRSDQMMQQQDFFGCSYGISCLTVYKLS
jgi:hypothetical protein